MAEQRLLTENSRKPTPPHCTTHHLLLPVRRIGFILSLASPPSPHTAQESHSKQWQNAGSHEAYILQGLKKQYVQEKKKKSNIPTNKRQLKKTLKEINKALDKELSAIKPSAIAPAPTVYPEGNSGRSKSDIGL